MIQPESYLGLIVWYFRSLFPSQFTRHIVSNVPNILSDSPLRIDPSLPKRAELAWVKLAGLGAVTYLSVRRKEDGVGREYLCTE